MVVAKSQAENWGISMAIETREKRRLPVIDLETIPDLSIYNIRYRRGGDPPWYTEEAESAADVDLICGNETENCTSVILSGITYDSAEKALSCKKQMIEVCVCGTASVVPCIIEKS